MAFFSVITVNLNNLHGLIKTHQSLLAQTYVDYEWVVVDGLSADGSVEYLASILTSDLMWTSTTDAGIYDAMNKGIVMSKGCYLVFMNSGDTFFSCDSLRMVQRAIGESNEIPDIVFGGALLEFGSGRSYIRRPQLAERIIWHGLPANHQASYYRRSILNGNPYDLRYSLCGDYYIDASLIKNGARPIYISSPLAVYDTSGKSSRDFIKLFLEPYLIQKNILQMPFLYRLLSLLKRFFSVIAFQALRFAP